MRPLTDREEKPRVHKPCSSWGSSITLISVNTAAHKQSRSLLECIDYNFLLQVTEAPRRGGAVLDLFLPTRRGWQGMWSLRAASRARTTKWSLRSLGQQGRCTESSLPWTSGKQILAFSEICLMMYHGIQPWREEGPRKAGWYSRIIFSKVRSDYPNKEEVRQKCH